MKRTIWKSVHRLLNVQSRIHLFNGYSLALNWIQVNRAPPNGKTGNLNSKLVIPAELNLELVKKNAHIKLVGKDQLWSITAYRNIILLKIQNHWTPENIQEYTDNISGLPSLLLEKWSRIFLLFDVTLMEFDIKDAPRFLRSNWLKFLDRDDMTTCIVHRKKMNRFLWRQLLWQIGKLEKVKVFSDCNAALTWIRKETMSYSEDLR